MISNPQNNFCVLLPYLKKNGYKACPFYLTEVFQTNLHISSTLCLDASLLKSLYLCLTSPTLLQRFFRTVAQEACLAGSTIGAVAMNVFPFSLCLAFLKQDTACQELLGTEEGRIRLPAGCKNRCLNKYNNNNK